MAQADRTDGIETSEHIPVFVDVAGPRGEDGYRPVMTQRLAKNINTGIWRYEEGQWELTTKGRKAGFIPLTKPRYRANGTPEYLNDRCKGIADAADKRMAERKAEDEYERGVVKATKTGSPKPKKRAVEEVLAESKNLVARAEHQRDRHPAAADAPPDPPGWGDEDG